MGPHQNNPRSRLPFARAVRIQGLSVTPPTVEALRARFDNGIAELKPVAEDVVRHIFAFLPLILPVLLGIGMVWIGVVANSP